MRAQHCMHPFAYRRAKRCCKYVEGRVFHVAALAGTRAQLPRPHRSSITASISVLDVLDQFGSDVTPNALAELEVAAGKNEFLFVLPQDAQTTLASAQVMESTLPSTTNGDMQHTGKSRAALSSSKYAASKFKAAGTAQADAPDGSVRRHSGMGIGLLKAKQVRVPMCTEPVLLLH